MTGLGTPSEDDELYPEQRIGAKIMEMCDRVKVAHAVAPGAMAKWAVEIDGRRFEITASCVPMDDK